MPRELVGSFGRDTPSRDIAKAIIAARQERKAKDAEQANPDHEARPPDPNADAP